MKPAVERAWLCSDSSYQALKNTKLSAISSAERPATILKSAHLFAYIIPLLLRQYYSCVMFGVGQEFGVKSLIIADVERIQNTSL